MTGRKPYTVRNIQKFGARAAARSAFETVRSKGACARDI
jgi:hypothetical protein